MIGRPPRPLMDRFLAKVDLPTDLADCWRWTGSLRSGYGQIRVKSEAGWSVMGAHRVSYELHVGPITDGLDLDHLCRNTWCVNPGHLEPVTRRENVIRGIGPSAVNARKTKCPAGHEFADSRYPNGSRRCLTCDPLPFVGTVECAGCPSSFTLTGKERGGRRRRFCTDACRIRFHNVRRSAERRAA